ncbi:MAG: hypothetical protein OCD02_02995 [Spirochaetaceae bacterium]
MEWDDKYSIGIKEIDDQHKQLFKFIKKYKEREKLLKLLLNYARYHFHSEELFMEKIKYPELQSHKEKHSVLIHELESILLNPEDTIIYNPKDFHPFLISWIIDHIIEDDVLIGKFYDPKSQKHQTTQDILEYNIKKLKLLNKYEVLPLNEIEIKRDNFIQKVFASKKIDDLKSLLENLEVIDKIANKGKLYPHEILRTKMQIIKIIDLENIIETEPDMEKKLEALNMFEDQGLITKEYFDNVKTSLLNFM